MQKILVLGSTGAMGRYLVPVLAEKGYLIDSVALDESIFDFPNVCHIKGDARDMAFRRELMQKNYDAIVDFVVYRTADLIPLMLPMAQSTGHYIYLSSYRIYDGLEVPTKETSPRLIDSTEDELLRNSDDYSIQKARGENILASLGRKNWSVIRPAVTYSHLRYQLVTLEAPYTVGRAQLGKTVVLPENAKDIQATMSWAGDAAQMIAGVILNDKALGECFTVATAEHHTWGEIAEYYRDICNLKALWVDQEDYLACGANNYENFPMVGRWQLIYDRLFHRVMDNSKILAVTGMKQEDLMPLYDGLKYEISRCPADFGESVAGYPINIRMDNYLAK